jgi:hypothetical protein
MNRRVTKLRFDNGFWSSHGSVFASPSHLSQPLLSCDHDSAAAMGEGDDRALPKVSFVKRLVRLIENGDEDDHMSFCDHCEGQRFDRAQVLRALRATRKRLRKANTAPSADQTIALAIEAVRTLEIPHLEPADELVDGEVVH